MGQIGEPEKIVHIPDPVEAPVHDIPERTPEEVSPVPEYVPDNWPESVPADGRLFGSST